MNGPIDVNPPDAAPPVPKELPANVHPFPSSAGQGSGLALQGHRQRLRDRLVRNGPSSLGDVELLEMILFQAMRAGDTRPLAQALIARHGSLARVLAADAGLLAAEPSLGVNGAAAIKLAHAAALRLEDAGTVRMPVLADAEALAAYLVPALAAERLEQWRALFLDPSSRLIADEAVPRSATGGTLSPRALVRRALELDSAALVLVHGRPAPDAVPDRDDMELAEAVRTAGAALDIALRDCLVVGRGVWTSLRQLGLI